MAKKENKKKRLQKIKKYINDTQKQRLDYYKPETVDLEKIFPIEVVASTFENRLLINYQELEEFWCFLTNETVDISNIERFAPIIKNEILKQHPTLKVRNYVGADWVLTRKEIKELTEWYKKENGETIKIKSMKKGYTKTLKIQ